MIYSSGDNLLTAVSVARDCGIVDMAMRVIIVHGTNEPPKMFFTNVNTKYVQFASVSLCMLLYIGCMVYVLLHCYSFVFNILHLIS